MTKPHCPAHYWAKQIKSDSELDLPDAWEVVQTFINCLEPFELRVFIAGQERSESLDNFEWGPRVIAPAGCTPTVGD